MELNVSHLNKILEAAYEHYRRMAKKYITKVLLVIVGSKNHRVLLSLDIKPARIIFLRSYVIDSCDHTGSERQVCK